MNIFVKESSNTIFKGYCWPGDSVWVDYINEGGRKFWASLYDFNFFNGTDDSFHIWLDMNEPSVFTGPELTMPKDVLHYLSDGSSVMSKDVKNIYGLLMMEATYEGMV